jgi:hypothetical protein
LTSFGFGVPECPPLFSLQPSNQAAVIGGQATFSARSRTSSNLTTNYQWYHNSAPLGGATNPVLTLSNLTAAQFGPYYVTLDYGPGWSPRTSIVANLTLAVAPTLTSSITSSAFNLYFQTEPGPAYVIEFKSTLTDALWNPWVTNRGTGGPITVTDSVAGVASRFYRVRVF